MTILIVEDNDSMRQMIKKLLGDLTEAFSECVDGAQALATYRRYRPDWVLLDIKLKEMDGLAATRKSNRPSPSANSY